MDCLASEARPRFRQHRERFVTSLFKSAVALRLPAHSMARCISITPPENPPAPELAKSLQVSDIAAPARDL
jgi:hypothetical protein